MNRKRQQAFRDRNKDTSEHQMNLNRKRQKIFREQNKKKKQEHNFSYYKKNKGTQNLKTQQKNANLKNPIQDSDTSEFNIFENDNTENMQKIFSRIDKKFCHATTVDDEDTCKRWNRCQC